ncbi:unnamed protein product [Amoebophrya sp. A120]|nr:unnamed protein product [Amoebophrya sp. A120]|eukprot:GSA120T00014718001.1
MPRNNSTRPGGFCSPTMKVVAPALCAVVLGFLTTSRTGFSRSFATLFLLSFPLCFCAAQDQPMNPAYEEGELNTDLVNYDRTFRKKNIKHLIPRKMGVPLAFGWQAGFDAEFENRPQVVKYNCVYAKTCPEKETWTAEMKPFKRSAYSRPVR